MAWNRVNCAECHTVDTFGPCQGVERSLTKMDRTGPMEIFNTIQVTYLPRFIINEHNLDEMSHVAEYMLNTSAQQDHVGFAKLASAQR